MRTKHEVPCPDCGWEKKAGYAGYITHLRQCEGFRQREGEKYIQGLLNISTERYQNAYEAGRLISKAAEGYRRYRAQEKAEREILHGK